MLDALEKAARDAGAAIMDVYASDFEAIEKSDGSPVTAADTAAEKVILPVLKSLEPDTVIISEENAESHSVKAPDRFFLVDPLDGTKEFLKRDGKGSFTVNIALIEYGIPILGVVYAPALDRLFIGELGKGAREHANGAWRDIVIRDVPADGPVAVASLSHRDEKTIGSSLKFCLVAAGEADVYPRFGPTMEWDTGAGDAVLRAAGGVVYNEGGEVFPYGKVDYRNGPFVACGKVGHPA